MSWFLNEDAKSWIWHWGLLLQEPQVFNKNFKRVTTITSNTPEPLYRHIVSFLKVITFSSGNQARTLLSSQTSKGSIDSVCSKIPEFSERLIKTQGRKWLEWWDNADWILWKGRLRGKAVCPQVKIKITLGTGTNTTSFALCRNLPGLPYRSRPYHCLRPAQKNMEDLNGVLMLVSMEEKGMEQTRPGRVKQPGDPAFRWIAN